MVLDRACDDLDGHFLDLWSGDYYGLCAGYYFFCLSHIRLFLIYVTVALEWP